MNRKACKFIKLKFHAFGKWDFYSWEGSSLCSPLNMYICMKMTPDRIFPWVCFSCYLDGCLHGSYSRALLPLCDFKKCVLIYVCICSFTRPHFSLWRLKKPIFCITLHPFLWGCVSFEMWGFGSLSLVGSQESPREPSASVPWDCSHQPAWHAWLVMWRVVCELCTLWFHKPSLTA